MPSTRDSNQVDEQRIQEVGCLFATANLRLQARPADRGIGQPAQHMLSVPVIYLAHALRCVHMTAINLALRNRFGHVVWGNSLTSESKLVYETGRVRVWGNAIRTAQTVPLPNREPETVAVPDQGHESATTTASSPNADNDHQQY